jgi:hypothetical protein
MKIRAQENRADQLLLLLLLPPKRKGREPELIGFAA